MIDCSLLLCLIVKKKTFKHINSFIFNLFKHRYNFTAKWCEKKPSIRQWDSNSWPHEHESPPLTTRPGLRPYVIAANGSVDVEGSCSWLNDPCAMGSGCGSAGKAVVSDNRGPRVNSRHWRSFYWTLSSVSCVDKTKIKKKRPIWRKKSLLIFFVFHAFFAECEQSKWWKPKSWLRIAEQIS